MKAKKFKKDIKKSLYLEALKIMGQNTKDQAASKGIELTEDVDSVYNWNWGWGTDTKKATVEHIKPNEESIIKDTEFKQANRWILKLPSGMGVEQHYVKSITRPRYPFINESIVVTLYEPTHMSLIKKIIEFDKDGELFDVELVLLGPDNIGIENWIIKKCTIKEIKPSELIYMNDSLNEIVMTLSFNSVSISDTL